MISTQQRTRIEQKIELHNGSPIRTRDGKTTQVHAVCHHLNHYLSRGETYPQRSLPSIFREQHDFPGLPFLDKRFARAAHAREALHFTWNWPALIGLLMVICGMLCFVNLLLLPIERVQTFTWLSLMYAIGTAFLIVMGGMMILRRADVYHRVVAGRPFVVKDFPLDCTYEVNTTERLNVTLGNTSNQPPVPKRQECMLQVKGYPEEANLEDFRDYMSLYKQSVARCQLYAGLMALENRKSVTFVNLPLEHEHRLKLHTPIPSALMAGSYDPERSPLFHIMAPYTIEESAFYDERDQRIRRFPLECVPKLNSKDSYTLELHFHWYGSKDESGRIDECILFIPPELDVKHVELGRYDKHTGQAIWRDLIFTRGANPQKCILRVICQKPLLNYHGIISGTYRCIRYEPISKLKISHDRIWNACGQKATINKRPDIAQTTILEGALLVDTKQLMQEHEYIPSDRITCHFMPDEDLVKKVLDIFLVREIDLLRIEHAAPRMDPSGTLHTQLEYWDIVGRYYQPDMMDSIDIHIVVSGQRYTPMMHITLNVPPTPVQPPQIDIRVRCLHDPRNLDAPTRANKLLEVLSQDLGRLTKGVHP